MLNRSGLVFLCLSALHHGAVLADPTVSARPNYAATHQRRELGMTDWWYTLLNMMHVPCPHHSTDSHPLGHCAHPSIKHHPHHHHHSGGGSHNDHTDDNTVETTDDAADENPCDDDDAEGANGCGESVTVTWGDDGWDDDGWHDDGHTDDGWHDDGHTDDAEGTDDYRDDYEGVSYASSSTSYRTQKQSSNSGSGWGIFALFACIGGACAFMIHRKRNAADERNERLADDDYAEDTIDSDPPVQDVSYAPGADEPSAIEMTSVDEEDGRRTIQTRASRIRSGLSMAGASVRSKFGRSRSGVMASTSNDAGDYQAPFANEGEAVV